MVTTNKTSLEEMRRQRIAARNKRKSEIENIKKQIERQKQLVEIYDKKYLRKRKKKDAEISAQLAKGKSDAAKVAVQTLSKTLRKLENNREIDLTKVNQSILQQKKEILEKALVKGKKKASNVYEKEIKEKQKRLDKNLQDKIKKIDQKIQSGEVLSVEDFANARKAGIKNSVIFNAINERDKEVNITKTKYKNKRDNQLSNLGLGSLVKTLTENQKQKIYKNLSKQTILTPTIMELSKIENRKDLTLLEKETAKRKVLNLPVVEQIKAQPLLLKSKLAKLSAPNSKELLLIRKEVNKESMTPSEIKQLNNAKLKLYEKSKEQTLGKLEKNTKTLLSKFASAEENKKLSKYIFDNYILPSVKGGADVLSKPYTESVKLGESLGNLYLKYKNSDDKAKTKKLAEAFVKTIPKTKQKAILDLSDYTIKKGLNKYEKEFLTNVALLYGGGKGITFGLNKMSKIFGVGVTNKLAQAGVAAFTGYAATKAAVAPTLENRAFLVSSIGLTSTNNVLKSIKKLKLIKPYLNKKLFSIDELQIYKKYEKSLKGLTPTQMLKKIQSSKRLQVLGKVLGIEEIKTSREAKKLYDILKDNILINDKLKYLTTATDVAEKNLKKSILKQDAPKVFSKHANKVDNLEKEVIKIKKKKIQRIKLKDETKSKKLGEFFKEGTINKVRTWKPTNVKELSRYTQTKKNIENRIKKLKETTATPTITKQANKRINREIKLLESQYNEITKKIENGLETAIDKTNYVNQAREALKFLNDFSLLLERYQKLTKKISGLNLKDVPKRILILLDRAKQFPSLTKAQRGQLLSSMQKQIKAGLGTKIQTSKAYKIAKKNIEKNKFTKEELEELLSPIDKKQILNLRLKSIDKKTNYLKAQRFNPEIDKTLDIEKELKNLEVLKKKTIDAYNYGTQPLSQKQVTQRYNKFKEKLSKQKIKVISSKITDSSNHLKVRMGNTEIEIVFNKQKGLLKSKKAKLQTPISVKITKVKLLKNEKPIAKLYKDKLEKAYKKDGIFRKAYQFNIKIKELRTRAKQKLKSNLQLKEKTKLRTSLKELNKLELKLNQLLQQRLTLNLLLSLKLQQKLKQKLQQKQKLQLKQVLKIDNIIDNVSDIIYPKKPTPIKLIKKPTKPIKTPPRPIKKIKPPKPIKTPPKPIKTPPKTPPRKRISIIPKPFSVKKNKSKKLSFISVVKEGNKIVKRFKTPEPYGIAFNKAGGYVENNIYASFELVEHGTTNKVDKAIKKSLLKNFRPRKPYKRKGDQKLVRKIVEKSRARLNTPTEIKQLQKNRRGKKKNVRK